MHINKMVLAVRLAFNTFSSKFGLALGAVALELTKEEHTKLPKDVQALYEEKDGKFKLSVELEDTKGLKSALEAERAERKKAERLMKELTTQWEGLDPKEIRNMIEKLGGDQEAQLIKAGKIDEVVALRTEKLRKEFEKQLTKAQDDVKGANSARDKFTGLVLDNHVRAAATKAGLHPHAVDDALFRARSIFKLDEEGQAVQLDADNKPVLGKDGKTKYSPSEWLDGMKEQAPHWYPNLNAGGGSGGDKGGKGGAKTIKRSAFDAMTPADKAKAMNVDKLTVVD
jgi:hypothetical protein